MKPHILQKIESFYQKNIAGKTTIGIHIRGTDKRIETAPIKIETIIASANMLAKFLPGCQFLVATDEQVILDQSKKMLQGPVIYYPATRSINGKSLHHHADEQDKPKLGEEVLIEAQLLARCSLFLHTCSNVSTTVLFFNPDIENILFAAGR